MLAEFFDQTFALRDAFTVLVLIVLEGTLSIDNALVLGLLAKRLPPHQRKKALTYGLVGAFVFRFAAIGFATWLLHYPVVKLLGGAYLIYVAVKHFFFTEKHHDDERASVKLGPDGQPILEDETTATGELTPEQREQEIAKRTPIPESADPSKPEGAPSASGDPAKPLPALAEPAVTMGGVARKYAAFWPTVFVIEMTDIAFAVDSIMAAVGFIPPNPPEGVNPKLWVVLLGGFIGVVLMRFAATIFIKLLDRFPRFELAAYLLVTVIGLKLSIDYIVNGVMFPQPADWAAAHPNEAYHGPLNFHSPYNAAFWVFWVTMTICFVIGFMGAKKPKPEETQRGFEVGPGPGTA
jgi:predicted tellurium resistance membrane protein TerC